MTDRKTALVTGASRGFGYAVAEALGAKGWHVIAVARTVGGLEELDDAITAAGGSATLVPLDLLDDDGLNRLGGSVFERFGGLDLFLHAAFFAGPLSPIAHMPHKDWDKTVSVNIRATGRLIASVEPLLRARHGRAILPVDAGPIGTKFFAAYGTAKAAQAALWSSWAAEAHTDIAAIETFQPAAMPTALRARFFPGEDRSKLTPTASEADRLLHSIHL